MTPPTNHNVENSPREGCQPQADGVFSTKAKFIKYAKLPYNPKLKDKAKALRKAGVLSEVIFWNAVKNKKLLGLDFERQKIIGNFIVDFYCPELGVVVEIDGESHDFKGEYDQDRENYLKSLGLDVIHYSDLEIRKALDVIMGNLYIYLKSKKEQSFIKETPRQPAAATPHEGNVLINTPVSN